MVCWTLADLPKSVKTSDVTTVIGKYTALPKSVKSSEVTLQAHRTLSDLREELKGLGEAWKETETSFQTTGVQEADSFSTWSPLCR